MIWHSFRNQFDLIDWDHDDLQLHIDCFVQISVWVLKFFLSFPTLQNERLTAKWRWRGEDSGEAILTSLSPRPPRAPPATPSPWAGAPTLPTLPRIYPDGCRSPMGERRPHRGGLYPQGTSRGGACLYTQIKVGDKIDFVTSILYWLKIVYIFNKCKILKLNFGN